MKTILFSFIFCLIHVCLSAQPGTLDSSFGMDGRTMTKQFYTNVGFLQQDNKILCGGSSPGGYGLRRYLPDGSIDENFGKQGVTSITDSIFSGGRVQGIIVLQDSSIITTGPATSHAAVVKFKANGQRDSSFGINGVALPSYNDELENMTSVQVQQDGKIVTGGGSKTAFESDMVLIRYNADGSKDQSFGIDGRVKNPVGAQVNCLAIQTDGKIITAGQFYVTAGPDEFIINRYNADGSIDKTFGINGMVKTVFGTGTGIDNPFSVKILKDGSFLVSGIGNWFSGGGDKSFMAIARYKADGSLDSSFGVFGKSKIIFPNESSAAKGMCLQDDGKIILGGYVGDNDISTNWDVAMARLNSDGILDSSFGISGLVQTDFGGSEQMEDVMLQKNGDIILAGNSQITELKEDALITRYLNNEQTKKQVIINKIKHYISTHNNATAVTLNNNITLYPNPANNILIIKGLNAINNYQLIINNAKGSVVATKQVNDLSSYQFNVQNLSSGVYYVNVVANNKLVATLKFVKQ